MRKTALKIFLMLLTAMLISCSTTNSENLNQKEETKTPPPLRKEEVEILNKLGAEILPDGNIRIGLITIDRVNMELSFPAKVNMRGGELEVLICIPGGRAHESLLISDADPFHLQLALILLGAENGLRIKGGHLPQGSIIKIDVQAEGAERHPIEKWLLDARTEKEKKYEGWVFVGSNFTHNGICMATEEGNLVNIWSFGNTILDNPSPDATRDDLIQGHKENTPPVDTNVTVFMKIDKNSELEKSNRI